MKMVVAALLCGLLLAGCATAPGFYAFNKSQAYSRSYDETWEDLVRFFASNDIEVKHVAKDSGVIYAEMTRFGDDIADCGSSGLWRVVGKRGNFNVFVSRIAAAPTVQVNTKFVEERRFDTNFRTVDCSSRGVIEQAILTSVRQ